MKSVREHLLFIRTVTGCDIYDLQTSGKLIKCVDLQDTFASFKDDLKRQIKEINTYCGIAPEKYIQFWESESEFRYCRTDNHALEIIYDHLLLKQVTALVVIDGGALVVNYRYDTHDFDVLQSLTESEYNAWLIIRQQSAEVYGVPEIPLLVEARLAIEDQIVNDVGKYHYVKQVYVVPSDFYILLKGR